MLTAFPPEPGRAIWLDLLSPTEAERDQVEAIVGHPPPTREALSEIESSSRARVRDGMLTMSVPSGAPHLHAELAAPPIGFMLSPERLVTIRYGSLKAFESLGESFSAADPAPTTGLEVFVGLCEEIVDRVADGLEALSEVLGELSLAAFHVDDAKGHRANRSGQILRRQLRKVGRTGDRLSQVRDGLLGLARAVTFVTQNAKGWTSSEAVRTRLETVAQDIASLKDYEEHLANKVQFLLDAMVGLIGIAQNDIFKVLTIVSIAGIPPTLVAGIYGMNFKNMPEYNWHFGYQWGLGVIVVSTLIPLIWFKIRGWF